MTGASRSISQVRVYAGALAKRLADEAGADSAANVRLGYEYTLSRSPDADELAAGLEFVAQQTERYRNDGKPRPAELALTDFCQTLFSLSEFIFVD